MLSGLPGVGKSYFAQALAVRLGAVVVSVDPIEDAIIRSGIPMSFETGVAAYEVGAAIAAMQLRNGLTVIADAANDLEVGRDIWRTAADAAAPVQVKVKVIEVTCSDVSLHRARLERRHRGLTEYPEPTWEHVVRRAADAEPWTCPTLVVDSAGSLDDMVRSALVYVAG